MMRLKNDEIENKKITQTNTNKYIGGITMENLEKIAKTETTTGRREFLKWMVHSTGYAIAGFTLGSSYGCGGGGGGGGAQLASSAPNTAPVIPGIQTQTFKVWQDNSLTVQGIYDPEGDAIIYSVEGLPSEMTITKEEQNNGKTDLTISGKPLITGSGIATLKVKDGKGAESSRTFNWNVKKSDLLYRIVKLIVKGADGNNYSKTDYYISETAALKLMDNVSKPFVGTKEFNSADPLFGIMWYSNYSSGSLTDAEKNEITGNDIAEFAQFVDQNPGNGEVLMIALEVREKTGREGEGIIRRGKSGWKLEEIL
ncbi:MAG TPA: putative Ig domain-containing protein [Candidatus Nanoarchaeia archaeon]|nr:putative Ig domain-containing protein [Candidatus Nanoarchaeia archaeon]